MNTRPTTAASLAVATWLGVVVFWASASPGGTIRHDRADAAYQSLASRPQYACTGLVSGSVRGSGTLIAPDWVLTAGHLVDATMSFTVNGATYTAASIVKYPDLDAADVALVRLVEQVAGVAPARLYRSSLGSEWGREAVQVGFGRSGTGLTGEVTSSGTKRAGQNTIDAWGSSNLEMLTDFDSPDGTDSAMGSTLPLDLEIGSAHGDSGGGLFVEVGGRTYLAGVQTAMWYLDGTPDADYGDGGVFARVAELCPWILATLPTPLPGDATRDGRVNARDAAALTTNWLRTEDVFWEDGDFNADGRVDDLDASILAAHWQYSGAGAAVPEPAWVVLAAGLVILLGGMQFCQRPNRRYPPHEG